MTLTEQLDALIAEHRLSSITITRHVGSSGYGAFWGINAQGDGEIGSNSTNRPESPSEGVAEAINELNAKRTAAVVAPELETLA